MLAKIRYWMIEATIAAVAIVLLLLVTGVVHAQSMTGRMILKWDLPTLACDQATPPVCVPLTGNNALTGVNVWISESPIADSFGGPPTVVLQGNVTTTDYTRTVANGTRLYARIKAINPSGPSAFSNEDSKLFEILLPPNAPTNLTIEFQLTP